MKKKSVLERKEAFYKKLVGKKIHDFFKEPTKEELDKNYIKEGNVELSPCAEYFLPALQFVLHDGFDPLEIAASMLCEIRRLLISKATIINIDFKTILTQKTSRNAYYYKITYIYEQKKAAQRDTGRPAKKARNGKENGDNPATKDKN